MDYMVCDITFIRENIIQIEGILKNCEICIDKVFQSIDIVTSHDWQGIESSIFWQEALEMKNINSKLNAELLEILGRMKRFIDKVEDTDDLFAGKFMRVR